MIIDEKGWNRIGDFRLYLMEVHRGVGAEVLRCLDIEYVRNWNNHRRGKGDFWPLITRLEQEAKERGYQALCLKEVINERLLTSLPARGFVRLAPTSDCAPTFLKRVA